MREKAILVILTLTLAITGCARGGSTSRVSTSTPNNPVKGEKMPLPKSHSVSKADEKLLLRHTRENLEIIMAVRDETRTLAKALGGTALEQMNEQIAADKEANRVKVRRYDDMKLKVRTDTRSLVGVVLTFTDNSYLISAQTGAKLDEPTGKPVDLLLAVDKVKKRWIIKEIFSKGLVPEASKT